MPSNTHLFIDHSFIVFSYMNRIKLRWLRTNISKINTYDGYLLYAFTRGRNMC